MLVLDKLAEGEAKEIGQGIIQGEGGNAFGSNAERLAGVWPLLQLAIALSPHMTT
jgi:hypothetical protein